MGFKKTAAGIVVAAFTGIAGLAAGQAAPQPPPAPERAPTTAPATSPDAVKYINALHLAYVRTGADHINSDSQKGLESLRALLIEKTTVAPAGVVGLDVEKDELTFFPFIYWPVPQDAQPLSPKAQKKVQAYIDTGGVILFDTRGQSAAGGTSKTLRRMLGDVSIKPLVPMDKEHTLSRSFYLTAGLPGSSSLGTVWVEAPNAKNKENVSSVIIGENNWAAAWAGKTLLPASREKELALRSGINIVMYALAGNYKADQVHVPLILEKLERK